MQVAGMPDWVTNAMTFVAQSHDIVTPQVELSGFDIAFSDDNLFAEAKAKASKCQLRKFVVMETGDEEQPDVEMQFVIYAPFSRGLWAWAGQYGGEECWAQFTQVEEPEAAGGGLELTGDEPDDEEEAGEVAEG